MQDEQRKESEKAESRECREESYREEAELEGSSDIWNITTESSIPVLSGMHSSKANNILIGWHAIITSLLVGMLITHVNLTQSIAPLCFSSVSTYIHGVR